MTDKGSNKKRKHERMGWVLEAEPRPQAPISVGTEGMGVGARNYVRKVRLKTWEKLCSAMAKGSRCGRAMKRPVI